MSSMARLSLEDLDTHIDNLRSQLRFLHEVLSATDHNTPDWLATDLISLRNKSGRLHDDMKRFKDQLEAENLVEKKIKTSHKRLSLEGAMPSESTPKASAASDQSQAVSPPVEQTTTPHAKPAQSEETYVVRQVDVTEEVHRRLQESRLRRLMETPKTAQKRKYDAYEDTRSESTIGAEDDGPRNWYSDNESTPTKRIKYSGTFEQTGKRKENDATAENEDEDLEAQLNLKRRKL